MSLLARIRPLLPPLAVLAVGAAVLAVLVMSRPEPPAGGESEKAWVVDTRRVQPRAIAPTLTLYGRLESPSATTLSAAVAAEVQAVAVREGQSVSRGRTLVALDPRDLAAARDQRQADLAEAGARIEEARVGYRGDRDTLQRRRALVELARRGVDRAERLADRDVGSRAQLDAARQALEQARLALAQARQRVAGFPARLERLKAQRRRARARLGQAERDLARTRVKAPFDGRVTTVEVAPGDRTRVGDPLVALYDPAALEVRATIPASRVAPVRAALEAERAVTAEVRVDGRAFRARLDRLGGRSAEGAAGVDGLFRVQGPAPADLPLNRFAELTVELPPQPGVVAVPFSALYGRDRLYLVRDGRLHGIAVVRVGQRAVPDGPDQLLVRSPAIGAGERVLTTQLPNAAQGLSVRTGDGAEGGG
ncbi:MAG TPA: biotin/lipoyl-binding protein [Gammaproteobacteria bacterium]|nr:biotin/lipoyl-binding protein [Gammaproteobacteria bacterium]